MRRDSKKYRILVIEDNLGDFVIVEDLLTEQILLPEITHVSTFKEAFDTLTAVAPFDIILMDLSLPDKSGQQLVTEVLAITSSCCPVIILTGYTDIDFSIKAVAQGVSDYLLKDDLNGAMLYKSIIYAIERKASLLELERSQKQFSDLFELSPQPILVFDSETLEFVQVNKATVDLYGYSEAEFLQMSLMDIKRKEDIPQAVTLMSKPSVKKDGYKGIVWHYKKCGDLIEVEIYSTPVVINNRNCRSVIAIDVTEKNQYENKITRAIIKTQEDERYEIGAELHDNVCQILVASQVRLGLLGYSVPGDKMHLLDHCTEHIKLALDEIRNLSHRLAPAFFEDSNLEEAFKNLFDSFVLNEHTQVLLHFDASVKKHPLSMELQLNLYRILQEQLRNILKYADASIINVNVLIKNNNLKMQIIDNGIGFDLCTAKKGIGLANMRRRTELFSGLFNIETSPGNGCTITVEILLADSNLPQPVL